MRTKQPWAESETALTVHRGTLTELSMRCLARTGQLDHVQLLLQCFIEYLPKQGYPLPLMMLSGDCGYPLFSGEHRKEQPCLHCTRPCVRSCACLGKQGAVTLCWGSSSELSTEDTLPCQDHSHHSRVSCLLLQTCCGQCSNAVWLLKSVLWRNWSPACFLYLSMFSFYTL